MGGVSNPPVAANPNLPIWNASKLQGKAISDQAPNDGDVYVWSAANQRFEPAPGGGGLTTTTEWGDIDGNLGDQTDLASALNAKADGAAVTAAIADFETTTQLNARDTANRNRDNHTGAQPISTVTGLQTALDGKAATTAIADFETTTQLNARDTANRDRDNHTGAQPISTVTGLQTALDAKLEAADVANLGGRYTRVNPSARELDAVIVSTTGTNYTLASIPNTGNYLVHCFIFAGSSLSHSVVFASPDDTPKPVPSSGAHLLPVHVGAFNPGSYLYKVFGEYWLPAKDGQIWARRNGSDSVGVTLDVLGYMEI